MSHIRILISSQTLELLDDQDRLMRRYLVSTSSRGVGEKNGSYRTPRGRHIIRAKIGHGQPANTVFVERRPTGEVYSPELASQFPRRDWMLTRLLWLSGCEPGFNRLGEVDTMRRFIYLHGSRTPRSWDSRVRLAACACAIVTSLNCSIWFLSGSRSISSSTPDFEDTAFESRAPQKVRLLNANLVRTNAGCRPHWVVVRHHFRL